MLHRHLLVPAIALSACSLLLTSCRSPVPVWNEDGMTMTDLRTLRHHGKKSVTLRPGVRLYADEVRYQDKRKRTGEAFGRVLLVVEPAVRYEWMIKYGYAGKAFFDKKENYVELADQPMLEREFLTQIATEPYTTIAIRWDPRQAEVIVRGPSRTDFAKSHRLPPGMAFPAVPLPPQPARKSVAPSGFSKR